MGNGNCFKVGGIGCVWLVIFGDFDIGFCVFCCVFLFCDLYLDWFWVNVIIKCWIMVVYWFGCVWIGIFVIGFLVVFGFLV